MLSKRRKKKLELSKDSFVDIAQELYNDLNEQANKCSDKIAHNNLTQKPTDIIEFVNLNKINNELLKIIDLSLQKKIMLLKIMSTILYKNGSDDLLSDTSSIKPEDLSFIKDALSNVDDFDED
jgi:hypothetical protein